MSDWRDRKLHLIGIGGAGMSALALVADRLGATVSGSDRASSSYTERLVAAGIPVAIGHDAANVPEGAEIVVSTAIGDDNPELAVARAEGRTILHRADLLREFVALKPVCIAVAGAHGKTTTTAMIGHALTELGADPAVFVGGEVRIGGELTNARWGDGEIVVVEADESDGSFLKLDPTIAIVSNVELDHHDSWQGGLVELMAAFAKFAAPARETIVWRGQPELASLVEPRRTTTFGLGDEDLNLAVSGEHNVLNALAALAALRAAGYSGDAAIPALESFQGVARRFEYVGDSPQGVHIYDDYAHHPTELVAALKTAREIAAGGRVVAVFQPHLYSRTAALAAEFGAALTAADEVVLVDIYPARERAEDFPGVDTGLIAAAIGEQVPALRSTKGEAADLLRGRLRPGDLCITVGAGDVFVIGRELIDG